MAKFNIEVELDWVNEEDGYNFDDELKERVIEGVEEALLKKATTESVKAIDDKIVEKVVESEHVIQEAIDKFIANICEEKMEKIMIPEKESSWGTEVKYTPLTEYVGNRFEKFLTEKRYDKDGNLAHYTSDRKYSAAQVITSEFLEKELGEKVSKMIANAKKEVENSLIKSLEQKLKENIAKDTIEKMNIPEVLKRFSEMGLERK